MQSARRRFLAILTVPLLVATTLVAAATPAGALIGGSVFINEIHYDNTGSDSGEAFEIAGPAGTDLSSWSVVLYNGNGGASYNTISLSGTIPDQQNGFGTLSFMEAGIQNGDPDGIALVDDTGTLVEFLSYEGSFTAVGGPADGITSTDIGVTEPSSTPVGDSLQRIGTGTTAADFTFAAAQTNTFGAVNTGQTFGVGTPNLLFTQYVEGSSNNKAIEIANIGSGSADLADFALERYTNGSATVSATIALSGTLAAGEVFVIANPSASAAILAVADLQSGSANWNGNDALVLREIATSGVVDSFGRVGEDPGAQWEANGVGTEDQTLCRLETVTSGDTDELDAFDPSVEWATSPEDFIGGLGELGCGPTGGTATPRLIHEIQGTGATVVNAGETVEVTAVVTSLFERDDTLDGFFIQEEDVEVDADPATSEGIFVFCRVNCISLTVGDQVTVTGTTTDFFGMSQIDVTGSGTIIINSSGNALPTATAVSLPASGSTVAEATFENIEGMVVNFAETLAVSEYFEVGRFGEVVLNDTTRPFQFTHTTAPSIAGYTAFLDDLAKSRIVLDDDNSDNNDAISDGPDEAYAYPSPGLSNTNRFRGGDTITGLTGVMHWSFSGGSNTDAWRIRPIDGVNNTFTPVNARPAAPDAVGGDLKVASFNVLNYFTTLDDGTNTCGPNALGCRGANSAAELVRQTDKIVDALNTIDADIVGVIEVENDSDDSSVAQLVAGLNSVAGAGTYAHLATGFIGTDAIKVGFIYKPASVTAVGPFAILDSSVDLTFIDTKNRPVLIQTFEQPDGEKLTIAVNHLKSKGSSCADVGDPGTGDGQANCAGTRTAAAIALANYLATDPTGSGDADFLIMGDLNAYAMGDPITALETAGYTDLIEQFGGSSAYSFVFDGQLGYLDHALATSDLLPQITGVTEWHSNADEINIFDYNDDVADPGEQSFERESGVLPVYEANAYRASDHDPLIIGLNLTAPVPTCNGLEATIVGTPGNDRINGTNGDDVIVSLGGNDTVFGRRGNDTICLGDGNDKAFGHAGNDTIYGEDGNDRLTGHGEDDMLDGGDGNDTLLGQNGDDTMIGGDGNDRIRGGPDNDTAFGDAGRDSVYGDNGIDELHGGDDDDLVNGGRGDDVMTGGEGNDRLYGVNGDDNMSGDAGDDRLFGGNDDDTMDGGADTDLINGAGGFDTCLNGETNINCEA